MKSHRAAVLCFALVVIGACEDKRAPAVGEKPEAELASSPVRIGGAGTSAQHEADDLWIADDFTLAVARAKESGRLVFVDAWAEWCHTCWSMKRDVLEDARVRAFGDRYVMLEIDTDRPENAAFLVAHPVKLWPTFFVVDPVTSAVVAVRPGAMGLDDTVRFLDGALRSARQGGPEDALLKDAYRTLFAGDAVAALALFERAVEKNGSRRTEAVLGAIRCARESSAFGRALELAEQEIARLGAHALVYDVASAALHAAHTSLQREHIVPARALAERALAPFVENPPAGLSVDDRADLMGTLAELARERGDAARARALEERLLQMLEDDAAKAGTPEGARVHDYLRMNAYLSLGRGDEAVRMLEARTQELPSSYEAWARLASTFVQLKRPAEAKPAIERALALSYGPRRLRYLMNAADIHHALDDGASERAALERVVAENAALPTGMRLDALAKQAEERLKTLR
jgi:tetratricopeptide (TPR) repeat protein